MNAITQKENFTYSLVLDVIDGDTPDFVDAGKCKQSFNPFPRKIRSHELRRVHRVNAGVRELSMQGEKQESINRSMTAFRQFKL